MAVDITSRRAWVEPEEFLPENEDLTHQQGGTDDQPEAPPEPAPELTSPRHQPLLYLDPNARHQYRYWADRPGTQTAQPESTSATSDAAPPPPAPTPPPPSATATTATSYAGEKPVDGQWLQDREAAFRGIRSDYEAQRAQAQAGNGSGPGWVLANMVTDESGHQRSASGAPTVFIPDPSAEPTVIGYDEGGPVYGPPPGKYMEFSEEAFAAHYRAQGGAQLQQLATLYETDVSTLMAQHPGLLNLALTDHALNAGPPPPGRAMGDPAQLGMLDLYMADPQIAELIATRGGTVPPATSAIAQEQVRIYGQARYEQLTRLSNAMAAVRNDFSSAMAQAQQSGQGPGWVERQRTITVSDEGGATRTEPMFATDESGARTPIIDRTFDPDAFTQWYIAQDGASNKAFAQFYGPSQTQWTTDESGRNIAATINFANANWQMNGVGGGMTHRELVSLDPNHAPRLNNDSAVGFDLEAGWATHQSNIHQERDWFETIVQVAIVGIVSWVSAGTLGPAVAGGLGLTTTTAAGATVLTATGVVVSAAVTGAAASLASGMMSGNLQFKGILKGALSGALTAGLMNGLGSWAQQAGPIGSIALRTTVQGGIQALLGGKFRDGALAGFASGLADLTSQNINQGIDEAVRNGTMSAGEAVAARMSARVLGSAIRALGNPNDPNYAFASAFVDSVVNDGLNATQGTGNGTPTRTIPIAFDDDGNLMPGIVDPTAPLRQQVAQLRDVLVAQGYPASDAASLAWHHLAPLPDPFSTISSDVDDRTAAEQLADQLGIPRDQIVNAGLFDEAGRSFDVLRGFAEGAGFSILATGEALLEVAKSPLQFARGVKALLTSAEARGQFSQEFIDRIKVDVQMLEDAFNAGDMRGTGQQLGKLTTDLAQIAGGVTAIARLGVSAGSAGGRLILRGMDTLADAALARIPSLFDAAGRPLMDFRSLSTAQKQIIGETMGAETVQRLVPDATRIGRVPTVGQQGIDDLYRVSRPDVDFVVVEYKFGSSPLGRTLDGLQMSDTWLSGANTGTNRILDAVGGNRALADSVSDALRAGRVERWVVHTDPLGNVTVGIVDSAGRFIPKPVSLLLGK